MTNNDLLNIINNSVVENPIYYATPETLAKVLNVIYMNNFIPTDKKIKKITAYFGTCTSDYMFCDLSEKKILKDDLYVILDFKIGLFKTISFNINLDYFVDFFVEAHPDKINKEKNSNTNNSFTSSKPAAYYNASYMTEEERKQIRK